MSQSERRLGAIMFTDIVGYSSITSQNEKKALHLLREHTELLQSVFPKYKGRIVKTMGDGFLVEFASAVEAVNCAVETQREIGRVNSVRGPDDRIMIKIGIHVGDIVHSADDVLGDAVNVAARVQPLAETGGICITRQVVDQVEGKVDYQMASVGVRELKNIHRPVELYTVVQPSLMSPPEGVEVDLYKRRLVVLPFANVSSNPKDEYFADGMTEELISTLSKIRELRVISRTSAMHYKNTNKSINEISRELKVASILEGSIRKVSDDLRITIQLIDAASDEYLWSQDYDRKLDNVFAIQKEIAQNAAEALRIQLLPSEKRDIEREATQSTEAHILYLKGRYSWNERTKEGTDKALKYLEEAVKLDPKFALAYAGLADCYVVAGDYGWANLREAFRKAKEYATKAIEIDPRIAEAHASLAAVFAEFEWKWHEAEMEYRQAIELKASYATAHQWYSIFLVVMRRFDEAYDQAKTALELDPLSRAIGNNLGEKLLYLGRIKEAIVQFERVIEANPDHYIAHNFLGMALYLDSRKDEAIEELKKAIELSGDEPAVRADLACVLGLVGRHDEAEVVLKELEGISRRDPRLNGPIGYGLFSVGRSDEAFEFFDRAFEEQAMGMGVRNFSLLPVFSQLRKDSRWVALEKRSGLGGV